MRPKKLPTLDVKLRSYQAEGIAHLLRQPYGGLLMDPGTGKTLTTLMAFYEMKRRGIIDKLFVVAPLRVAYEVWPAEIDKWKLPFKYEVLHGDNKDKLLDAADDHDTDIWIINYHGLGWLFDRVPDGYWRKKKWHMVLDESTKVKNPGTATHKNLAKRLHHYARRTILTGTPIPNGLEDLFGQVFMCDMGKRLGAYITNYRRKYFYPHGYDFRLQPGAEERIWQDLDGLFYRVSDDVLGLPPLERVRIDIRLPPAAKKTYQELEMEFVAKIGTGKITAVNAGVLSMKLRQAANGLIYDEKRKVHKIHDEKIEALKDLVAELGGSPLLVGFEFRHDGDLIQKTFKCPMVNGDSKPADASMHLANFNAGVLPVLALQMKSGSHGLNLQAACNHVAMYGQTWDLEIYEQFYKRVRRSGQSKTVFLHEFISKGTVETLVHSVVIAGKGSKKARQDKLLKVISERYL
jgi:SNF2 family DNA or RNA helicase